MAEIGQENLDLIEKCPAELISSFIHQVIDGVCGQTQPRFQDYSKVWSIEQWYTVVDCTERLFKSAVKSNTSKQQFTKHIEGLSKDRQQSIIDCYSVRSNDIRRTLVQNTTAISQAQMTDFDWKLKLVMSSDKIASVQEPLVSVDLDLQEEKGQKVVSLEMNQTELKKMITSLEAANKAVLQLKS